MKPSILFTGAALLASSASTFPNAAAILKGSGVQLSNEDLAKFNAVSEDVANAEKLFQEYQILRKRYQKRDSTNLARGLKLPLGGGLGAFGCRRPAHRSLLMTSLRSQWQATALYRRPFWSACTCTTAFRAQENTGRRPQSTSFGSPERLTFAACVRL